LSYWYINRCTGISVIVPKDFLGSQGRRNNGLAGIWIGDGYNGIPSSPALPPYCWMTIDISTSRAGATQLVKQRATTLSSHLTAKPVAARDAASLAERAYREIRDRILKGELPVGVALSRRRLADELEISVPPVMEALQHLERDGLVESKPRVGTRVRVPTRQDVEDCSIVREALESQAARLFAERATASEKKELQRMGRRVDQLYASYEKGAIDRDFLFSVNTYHMTLHLRIAECARCGPLRDAIEREQVLVFSCLFDTAVDRRALGSDFHGRLTEVLSTASPERAAKAMRQHIQYGQREVLEGLALLGNGEAKAGWRHKRVNGSGPKFVPNGESE
jgi:GntR family transcriptional regulator, rspAB operon transcriptional repressor